MYLALFRGAAHDTIKQCADEPESWRTIQKLENDAIKSGERNYDYMIVEVARIVAEGGSEG